jgi:hypothetical protein
MWLGAGLYNESGATEQQTWRCRDKSDATLWSKIDKMTLLLQLGRDAVGCEHDADGIGGPAETRGARGAPLKGRVWGYTADVGNVSAMRNAELYEGVRNLAR